ncbi:nitroreductase family protein [Meridianimarinicoccus aquatilis]|uniref:Putative NAD(P)H nitroreductase n=1 Tax=Meridianimarinicoccus aquatilis TaxID=2552766 RepID=A0A4R6ALA0_9RHOB|nr:nitroreductase family protein [Fluviibacterium aquatile]QIE42674.1 nitroreductase [Rhodobacteraceae bacterium SC52]TDL84407.1 nitroreductase [Fluviibacterium aquatile]
MPDPNPAALEFLLTRRSRPAKTLAAPWPDRDELMPILTAAARTPDHGKLEPWRFIVLTGAAPMRLAALAQEIGTAQGRAPDQIGKMTDQFTRSGCCVVVVSSPKASEKIPEIEQVHSAGAACLALLNAALASGWGANWLTGWGAHDPDFCKRGLGLAKGETVAGFMHIGSETSIPPERPRPDLATITNWHTE